MSFLAPLPGFENSLQPAQPRRGLTLQSWLTQPPRFSEGLSLAFPTFLEALLLPVQASSPRPLFLSAKPAQFPEGVVFVFPFGVTKRENGL